MSEVTLEKEILEEEKKGSIFETQAFKFTFEGLINAGKETGDKEELSNLLKTSSSPIFSSSKDSKPHIHNSQTQ